MSNPHRTNVLVTSCLRTPVDPQTKAPVALYERERVLPYSEQMDRDHDHEVEYEDSGSESGDEDSPGKGHPLVIKDYRTVGDHIDLSQIFFSNEEYYSKLEELKKAHLRTMAELESMYRKKLQLKPGPPWAKSSPASCRLRKCYSAVELRRGSGQSDTSEEEGAANNMEKGLRCSPKEHIKNMWQDFRLSPRNHRPSCSSIQSLPGDQRRPEGKKRQGCKDAKREPWKHRMTVPKPFHMTLREADRRRHGVKTRSQVELENAELRRQLEELTECQRKFRASPVPAHVHLPLFGELQERDQERRRTMREREEQLLRTAGKPFSFLERERLKKEQREEQLCLLQPSPQERVKPFKAKPVPKAVYVAASGEQMKEDQLYRSIKMQMRAKETLCSASMPPSMVERRLNERKKSKDAAEGDDSFSHSPKINREVPDFSARHRRFQKHLENRKEVKPITACEPFRLRTSQISSRRERILADIEKEQANPREMRWPYASPGSVRTPNSSSSLCSSLSGSLELLSAKVTDATKKRQEAVRKVLEQRRKVEEEEERWRERQKQREKKLQKVVLKRSQANDSHLALSQTNQTRLNQFRKQDLQRRREYQQEIKEIQERVKGRPLLLEQVAQRNAKQAAERRYADALRGWDLTQDLTQDYVSSKVDQSQQQGRSASPRKTSVCSDYKPSDEEEPDLGFEPVRYRQVYLDDEDSEEREGGGEEEREGDDSERDPAREDGTQGSDVIERRRSDSSGQHDHDNDSSDTENGEKLKEASDQED
ncbi:protein FAM161A [Diretmus argenteus]